jgi:hypothetical protein
MLHGQPTALGIQYAGAARAELQLKGSACIKKAFC